MDNLGWDTNPATFRNSEIAIPPANLWSSNHYVDNFSESELDYSIIASNKVELNGYFLNPNVIELQQDSVSLQRLNEMAEILAAAPTTFDYYSTNNNTLDLGFLHQEEAPVRLASNSAAYFSTTPSSIPDQVLLHSLKPLENLGGQSQEQEILAPQNLSNSGSLSSSGESEAAVNSHSHSIKTMRGNSKRKLEDQQHSCNLGGIFQIFFDKSSPNSKRPNLAKTTNKSSNIDFRQESKEYEPDTEAIAQVKEMIYRAAALRPMNLVLAEQVAEKPKRKNVRISSDPQTVAARHRRERISERLRVLQMLVPGGAKMDTASMLDEAANYLKFLKSQLTALETLATSTSKPSSSNSFACFQ